MPFQTITERNSGDDFELLTDSKLIRRFIRLSFNYRLGCREIRDAQVRTIQGEN